MREECAALGELVFPSGWREEVGRAERKMRPERYAGPDWEGPPCTWFWELGLCLESSWRALKTFLSRGMIQLRF